MPKRCCLLLHLILLVFAVPSVAQTYYVTENLNTYLRKGAGDQFKISGTIAAGEKVSVLERRERYSLIRDSRNREAWILNNELTDKPSAKVQLPRLQQQVDELTLKLNKIDSEWQQRTLEMQRRAQQADQQSSVLLEQNAQLKREVDMLKNKNRDLETLQNAESREIMIQYFIYGGTVLGAGLLLGLLLPLLIPRRKKRSNGWA